MINSYGITYEDSLNKSGKPNMNLTRTRSLCVEIYKTLNNLNPELIIYLFRLRVTKSVHMKNIILI